MIKKTLVGLLVVLVVTVFGVQWYAKKDLLPFDDVARAKAPYEMLKLEDGYVHYRQIGPVGGQPVILIHGLSTPLFSWNGIIKKLADSGMNVIVYDIYGRGWSDRPDIDNTFDLFDRQLDQLLTALKIEKPVDLVGMSMGALISAFYTEKHPDKVRRLGLVSPGGYVADFPLIVQLMRKPVIGSWLMDVFGRKAFLKTISAFIFENGPVPDLLERYEEMLSYQGVLSSVSSTLINSDLVKISKNYQFVGKSNKPVQVIWGTADGLASYKKNASLLKRDIPQLAMHAIEGGTHYIVWSHSDEVARVLTEFLQR